MGLKLAGKLEINIKHAPYPKDWSMMKKTPAPDTGYEESIPKWPRHLPLLRHYCIPIAIQAVTCHRPEDCLLSGFTTVSLQRSLSRFQRPPPV
jgi:hypothetical protein